MKNSKKLLALVIAMAMMICVLSSCGPQIVIVDGSSGTSSTGSTSTDTGSTSTDTGSTSTDTGSTSTDTGSTSTDTGSTSSDTGSTSVATTDLEFGLEYAEGTELRMATGYNSAKTGITFDADTAGSGVTLANGKTYQNGDLKPTWEELGNRLGITFTSKYQGNSASSEFDYWKEQLDQVDMVSGTAVKLNENGAAGSLVNIAEYLDYMPNFKAYLEANPTVRLSITGDTTTGAIYYSPYFDGVNDIERMPLMRADWVSTLLDGDGEFSASSSNNTATPVYEPYMPTSGTVDIDVVKEDGSGTETITKNYDAYGNIVQVMNDAGSVDGVTAVNMLREYIDETYDGYYGTTRSNLFIGQNAAWDADELVALLRCVVANPQTLNGTDSVQGIFSREENNNQRRVDLFRFAGTLFGVRGLESRLDYLYVGTDGELHDARQEEDTYVAIERMNAMAQEGLISAGFLQTTDETSEKYLENDLGFMSYDYNQTQTIYNETRLQDGEKYMAAMVPVALWFDGTSDSGVYMRFTESWRSVKTDGWAISKAGVAGDDNKLYAALALIDYAYSYSGQILLSYGPDEFIKTNADGSYVTFNFNGTEMPEISDATYAELWEKASGNYTNYARYYLGSTLSFLKSQAFEYQCTTDVGKEGAGYISTAIALGTIKHPELAVTTDNMWYTIVPTTLPTSAQDNTTLGTLTDLTNQFDATKDGANLLVDMIINGYSNLQGVSDAAGAAAYVQSNMSGSVYLTIENEAWEEDLDFYNNM